MRTNNKSRSLTCINPAAESETTATYVGTFDMQFYDAPTEYTVMVVAEDTGGLSGANSSTFDYTSCNVMSLDVDTVAFGSASLARTAPYMEPRIWEQRIVRLSETLAIRIDVSITGSDMTSGGDTVTRDYPNAPVAALGYSYPGVARCFDVTMATGASSLENVDCRLNVPYGIPVGNYAGSVMLTTATCR